MKHLLKYLLCSIIQSHTGLKQHKGEQIIVRELLWDRGNVTIQYYNVFQFGLKQWSSLTHKSLPLHFQY